MKALSTFVPETLKYILNKQQIVLPFYLPFEGVALFVDLSGFTLLTETLAQFGSLGIEKLADNVNTCLHFLITKITAAGGDIFKFAGDALICVWPPKFEDIQDVEKQKKELPNTLRRVINCALSIQRGELPSCASSGSEKNSSHNTVQVKRLRVKFGIGVGSCGVLIVGGERNRCEYLACGDAFAQAFLCENNCKPNDVVISSKCYDLLMNNRDDDNDSSITAERVEKNWKVTQMTKKNSYTSN